MFVASDSSSEKKVISYSKNSRGRWVPGLIKQISKDPGNFSHFSTQASSFSLSACLSHFQKMAMTFKALHADITIWVFPEVSQLISPTLARAIIHAHTQTNHTEDNRQMGAQCPAHTNQGFPLELSLWALPLVTRGSGHPWSQSAFWYQRRVRLVVNGLGTLSALRANRNPADWWEGKSRSREGEGKGGGRASALRPVEGIGPSRRANNLNEAFLPHPILPPEDGLCNCWHIRLRSHFASLGQTAQPNCLRNPHPVEQEPGVDLAVSWGPLTGIGLRFPGRKAAGHVYNLPLHWDKGGYLFNRSWYSPKHVASFIRIWNNPTQIIRDVRRLKVRLLYSVAMEIQVHFEVAWPGSRKPNWN